MQGTRPHCTTEKVRQTHLQQERQVYARNSATLHNWEGQANPLTVGERSLCKELSHIAQLRRSGKHTYSRRDKSMQGTQPHCTTEKVRQTHLQQEREVYARNSATLHNWEGQANTLTAGERSLCKELGHIAQLRRSGKHTYSRREKSMQGTQPHCTTEKVRQTHLQQEREVYARNSATPQLRRSGKPTYSRRDKSMQGTQPHCTTEKITQTHLQ